MNERILIVDEDKNIRDLLASALKASGYGVLEAQSFAQARMLALSHCPDLMLPVSYTHLTLPTTPYV